MRGLSRYAGYVPVIFLLLILCGAGLAQNDASGVLPEATPETTPEPDLFEPVETTIEVESAFVRVLPDQDAEAVASVFLNDIVEVVGRNVDGLWFEVRRPGRIFSLGWLRADLLNVDFLPENLPMTDSTTGLPDGETVEPGDFAIYIKQEGVLRDAPSISGARLGILPEQSVLPLLQRDESQGWVQVNYLGDIGWTSTANVRLPPNFLDVPVYVDPDAVQLNVPVIPPGVQLGQVERFRAQVQASYDVSDGLVRLWSEVVRGETMPCEPPPFVVEYLFNRQDLRELPELNRYVPRYNQGIDFLNQSIEALNTCGVYDSESVTGAQADAINARAIFDNTLFLLDELADLIRDDDDVEAIPPQ